MILNLQHFLHDLKVLRDFSFHLNIFLLQIRYIFTVGYRIFTCFIILKLHNFYGKAVRLIF